ncbi:MAG: hypothetical protein OXH52_07665 [Gammaproteobacteria bacterium]|nr:hypothetical protein [Gammaproteobacteria bacterium]
MERDFALGFLSQFRAANGRNRRNDDWNAIGQAFGSSSLVQRGRNHKQRHVLGHLPKGQHEQARSTLRAPASRPPTRESGKLEQYALWLERAWPAAAASLREGMAELFTVDPLGLPKALCWCLTTTIIIDSSHSMVRRRQTNG